MMGRTMVNIDSPVMKGTSGVLLINEKEAARRPMRNCIRCGKCVSACPMGLEPYLLMKLSQFNLLERMEEEKKSWTASNVDHAVLPVPQIVRCSTISV